MPARRKKAKKRAQKLEKQFRLIEKTAKKLDCDIRDLAKTMAKGNFRVL